MLRPMRGMGEWGLGTILDKQVCANRTRAVKLYQFGVCDYSLWLGWHFP